VVGVNSFGADSDGSDAEFYFAVSMRELLPFLRANELEARVSALPCRSLDELDNAERARLDAQRADARDRLASRDAELRAKRERAVLEAQIAVLDERENAIAAAMFLVMIALGSAFVAYTINGSDGRRKQVVIAAAVAVIALGIAIALWMTRPGLNEIDERVEIALGENEEPAGSLPSLAGDGALLCSLVPDRSRVTGARTDDVAFDWGADGCVNDRTQYGNSGGSWTRIMVPEDDDAVSVNFYDPQTRTFRTDRYLLGRNALAQARAARAEYSPPQCGITDAARTLGNQQSGLMALLPNRPNERLVYTCAPPAQAAVQLNAE
jgi:hypothetical protein